MSATGGWGVLYEGVYIGDGYHAQQASCSYGLPGAVSCSDIASTVEQIGFLMVAPEGLGLPGLETADFTRVGYDGVVHSERLLHATHIDIPGLYRAVR